MKKLLVLMMCSFALAFASCNPEPEPEPQQGSANHQFIGQYDGFIDLTGNANAPQLANFNMPDGMPIDSMMFHLTADITAGQNDNDVNVVFAIVAEPENQTYETSGTVNGNTINFGELTYTYVESPSTFDVTLTLTGNLEGNTLNLSGPASGTGQVVLDGFPIALDLTVEGNVEGSVSKIIR